jgi:hypothetical protein
MKQDHSDKPFHSAQAHLSPSASFESLSFKDGTYQNERRKFDPFKLGIGPSSSAGTMVHSLCEMRPGRLRKYALPL